MNRQIKIIKAKDIAPEVIQAPAPARLTQLQHMQKWIKDARASIQDRRATEHRSFYTQTA